MCNPITHTVLTAIFPCEPVLLVPEAQIILDFSAAKMMSLSRHVHNHLHLDPVKAPPPAHQFKLFTDWMPFLSPNQQCQNTESNIIK